MCVCVRVCACSHECVCVTGGGSGGDGGGDDVLSTFCLRLSTKQCMTQLPPAAV